MFPLTRRCCSHFKGGSLPTLFNASPWKQHSLDSLNAAYSLAWLARRQHDAATFPKDSKDSKDPKDEKAYAIVIGGGPAGMAVVGNLLVKIPREKIVWIDRSFEGGSINQFYREIPSYSPAGDYLQFARATKAFREICAEAPQPDNAVTALEALDPELTCPLSCAGDMLQMISNGLCRHERVKPVVGTVTQAVRNPRTTRWKVTVQPTTDDPSHTATTYRARLVVYCTGTRPLTTALPALISRLSLETGLSQTRLSKILPVNEQRTVAVIGSGHSAVLVLRNLFRLAAMTHRRLRIRWITRTAHLKYAEEREDDGVLLNEHDGLMGEAAAFARKQLEGDPYERGDAKAFIQRVVLPSYADYLEQQASDEAATEEGGEKGWRKRWGMKKGADFEQRREEFEREAMRPHLEGADFAIQCIGFTRSKLPEVRPGLGAIEGPIGKPKRLIFNALTGSFFPNGGTRDQVIGLFGAGSAFPESEFTTQGFRQPAVGVWKFMTFAQKMVPRWVDATRTGYFLGAAAREAMRERERGRQPTPSQRISSKYLRDTNGDR